MKIDKRNREVGKITATDDSTPEYYDSLSHREQDVLGLLAQNLSDREISARLFLSYTTVKWYNRQIFNKLGVDSRQKAVERAKLLGLLKTSLTSDSSKHNLPAQLTPFIGRMSELEHLSELIRQPASRLITILAPGGMGKTRLALELAAESTAEFADGVYFVSLAPLTLAEQIIRLIAISIDFQFVQDARTPKQQLLDFLHHKQVLLLLDNFEHLLDGALLVDEILQAAPHVKILVTSRERLNLNGETVFTIEGLLYPDQADAEYSLDYPAIQLFLQSALRVYPQFVLQDQKNMLRICQLVEGMPLAIELAAAWANTLSLAEIVTEITRSIDFLSTTMGNVPPRLRSIRAVFDATWSRLSNDERRVFTKMAVFHGGCTREAARVVAGANITILTGLVSKALLKFRIEVQRYDIHELVGQYAEEKLALDGEVEAALVRHQDYFGSYAQQWADALKTPAQLEALDKLDADYENIREAFERAIRMEEAATIEPFAALWYYFEIRGRYIEGFKLFETAISALNGHESVALAILLAGYGLFLERYYRFEQALSYAERSISILKHLGEESELPFSMMVLGDAHGGIKNKEQAAVTYAEAMEIARQHKDEWAICILTFLHGASLTDRKQVDQGESLIAQATLLAKNMGNVWGVSFGLGWLGDIAFQRRDYDAARSLYDEALAQARQVRHISNISATTCGLRDIAFANQDFIAAQHLTEDVLKIQQNISNDAGIYDMTIDLARIFLVTKQMDKARQMVYELLTTTEKASSFTVLIPCMLIAVAQYCQLENMLEQSVEMLSFTEAHLKFSALGPKNMGLWQRFIAQAQAELPAQVYAVHYDHGKYVTLEELIAPLIVKI